MIEIVALIVSAVGLVLQGAQMRQGSDSRKVKRGVFALERELSEWCLAMGATSSALDAWIQSSGTKDMQTEFYAAEAAVVSNIGYLRVVTDRIDDLTELLRVYAPDVADKLSSELSRRRYFLDSALLHIKRTYEFEGETVARYWLSQLEQSRHELVEARDQLRAFIREEYPAHS